MAYLLTMTCLLYFGLSLSNIALAQPEKYVTLYLESTDAGTFDLEKVQQRVSATLAKNGVSVVTFNSNRNSTTAKQPRFALGEVARITARIKPGKVIEGNHFSSYPVAIDITVLAANQESSIRPTRESARAQHVDSVSGLTSAISKALDKGLAKIGNDLAKFELPIAANESDKVAAENSINLKKTEPQATERSIDTSAGLPDSDSDSKQTPESTACDQSAKSSTLVISPSSVINRGESLNIISCYRTESASDQQVRIKTTIESKSDARRTLLNSKDFVLASGYWKSSFNFDVPGTISPGIYTLTQTIYRQGRVEYLKSDITIR